MQLAQPVPQCVPQGVQWQVVAPPGVPAETQTAPKQRKGARARLITGVIQALLGVVLLLSGIVVISVKFPDPHKEAGYYASLMVQGIDNRDRQSWAITVGLVALINSVFGILSKRNQVVISLYMAFSIFGSVLAATAIIPISISLAASNRLIITLRDNPESYDNPCKIEPYSRWSYSSQSSYQTDQERKCSEEVLSAAKLHLGFHCILLVCLIAQFVIAIIAASCTCPGLNCCRTTPNQHVIYYQAQVPQFQSPSPFQSGPPPPYPGLVVHPAAGQPLPPGGPPQQIVQYPVPQQPPPDMYPTPDVREPSAPRPDDDSSYQEPNSAAQRPPMFAPRNQHEYAYADTQYQPAPPPYENDSSRHSSNQPNTDQSYLTITG